MSAAVVFRQGVLAAFGDVLSPAVLGALAALAPLDQDRRGLMAARLANRAARARERRPPGFMDPSSLIPRTPITVAAARVLLLLPVPEKPLYEV